MDDVIKGVGKFMNDAGTVIGAWAGNTLGNALNPTNPMGIFTAAETGQKLIDNKMTAKRNVADATHQAKTGTNLSGTTIRYTGSNKKIAQNPVFVAAADEYNKRKYAWTESSISLNKDTGKITVKAPKKYLEDDYIKKMTNSDVLRQLSKNYQDNKDVKYQHPNDETKKVTTEEYLALMSESLQDRVNALASTDDMKEYLGNKYGGTPEKDAVINNLSVNDMITMSDNATGDGSNEKSLLSVPKWLEDIYPDVKRLSSYNADSRKVQKGDFLENFYSISNNLSGNEAFGLTKSPEWFFNNVEKIDSDELARTIAFQTFMQKEAPHASSLDKFWRGTGTFTESSNSALYEWGVNTVDFMANLPLLPVNLAGSAVGGDSWDWAKIDVREFAGLGDNGWETKRRQEMAEFNAAVNPDAVELQKAGYFFGSVEGFAVDTVLALVSIGQAKQAAMGAIRGKGAAATAKTAMAEAKAGDTVRLTAKGGKVARTAADAVEDIAKAGKNKAFVGEFNLNLQNAGKMFQSMYNGTEAALASMSGAQIAKVLDTARRASTATMWAGTALDVLGAVATSAVVFNKNLTTRVLKDEATSAETKNYLNKVLWDAAVMEVSGVLTGVGGRAIGKTISNIPGAERKINAVKQAASRAAMKYASFPNDAWLKFRSWVVNSRAARQAASKRGVSNAVNASRQAVNEAIVANEFRKYVASQPIAISNTANAASLKVEADATKNAFGTRVELDPNAGTLSKFEEAKASYVEFENVRTTFNDIETESSVLLSNFSDPNVEPVTSQYMAETARSNGRLLDLEERAGLLGKEIKRANKSIVGDQKRNLTGKKAEKLNTAELYANHSQEVAVYAARSQELQIEINKANRDGIPLEESAGYKGAKARYDRALEKVTPEIAAEIDNVYLPALRRAEHQIVNYAIDPKNGLLPTNKVTDLRNDGMFGDDGMDYVRFIGKKELESGSFIRNDRLVQNDSSMDIKKWNIPEEDSDIIWVGHGLNALIDEIAAAQNQKRLIDVAKKFDDFAVKRTVMAGETTEAMATANDLEKHFESAVEKGMRGFSEDIQVAATQSVGTGGEAFRAAAEKETSSVYGVAASDIDELRVVMKDEGIATTDSIYDNKSMLDFYVKSSDKAKTKLKDYFGISKTIGGKEQKVLSYDKMVESIQENPTLHSSKLDEIDRLNALGSEAVKSNKTIKELGKDAADGQDMFFDAVAYDDTLPAIHGANADDAIVLNTDEFRKNVDIAIDDMISFVSEDKTAKKYLDASNTVLGVDNSPVRTEFNVLSNILKGSNRKKYINDIKSVARKSVKDIIPKDVVTTPKELEGVYKAAEKMTIEQFDRRLSKAKTTLERYGERAESDAVTERLRELNKEITGYESEEIYVKSTNSLGQTEFLEVSPAIGRMYNNRPIYNPKGFIEQSLANMALLKRTSLTSVSPRAFSKQLVTDSLFSFVNVGAVTVPGANLGYMADSAARFGEAARQLEKTDPRRFQNILDIAARENISFGDAAMLESNARMNNQLPFKTMTSEVRRQAETAKYGVEQSVKMQNTKTAMEKMNSSIRKVGDVLGKPNDVRETATRKIAGAKNMNWALDHGYSWEQAENFGMHAIDNATANFRQKHTMFNLLRGATPYLTAGISGSKSFWKMFELDPVGVSSRIFGGLVIPIIYFMGEIESDENLREQYDNYAQWQKDDHIAIAVGGKVILIPVGEELGQIVNPITHMVAEGYDTNRYSFWLLMMNDVVNLAPVDLTGFTDPDLYENMMNEPPSVAKIIENGVAGVFTSTAPPILQSGFMAVTQRDPYTGRRIDSAKVSLDDDGNAVIQSYSQSEFSKALARIVGGDALVLEKVTSGIVGTTALHVLDTITSAVQYVGSGGESGSLTTALDKFGKDLGAPFITKGAASDEQQFWAAAQDLFRMKEDIERGNPKTNAYIKYNDEIKKTKDKEKRRKLINKRNDLLKEYQDKVKRFVEGYRDSGKALDGRKFTALTSLLVFEDALRADRAFMHLNTEDNNARAQALETLNSYGITNPDGVSMLGYIYRDKQGNDQLKLWTPAQMQIIYDQFYQQGSIHQARIKAILDDGTENSVKNQKKALSSAEQPYWDKYNSTGKLSKAEWDAIDDLRKAYNAKVVLALKDYVNAYGPEYILNDKTVIDYLEDMVQVPSSYERVKGRVISSDGGKLNKQTGFAKSYINTIFGTRKEKK